MATIEQIREILSSPKWTEAEKAVVKWQFRMNGSFFSALWEAIKYADDFNLARLHIAFPIEVEGFRQWTRGDLAQRLRAAGLKI